MSRKCTRCPAQIVDVTCRKKDGTTSTLPIDAEPSERGNITLDPATNEASVLAGERLAIAKAAGATLYINHFVTCPAAAAFRRPRA